MILPPAWVKGSRLRGRGSVTILGAERVLPATVVHTGSPERRRPAVMFFRPIRGLVLLCGRCPRTGVLG